MPDNTYSVQEDQVPGMENEQILSNPNLPNNMPQIGQQGSITPDQFEQSIIEQLMNTTPEKIREKKRKDYLRSISSEKSGKVATGINSFLKEFNNAKEASRNKVPYIGAEDRLTRDAQTEYEKSYPLLKSQVESIMKNRREEEKTKRGFGVQSLRNDANVYTQDTKKTIADTKAEIDRIRTKALLGDLESKRNLRDIEAAAKQKGFQEYPELLGLTKEMQDTIAPYLVQKKMGEENAPMLGAKQAQMGASQKPSNNASYIAGLPQDSVNAVRNQQQFESDLKKQQIAARATALPSYSFGKGMEVDPETGGLQEVQTINNRRTGEIKPANSSVKPFNTKVFDSDTQAGQAISTVDQTVGALIAGIQRGETKKFQGPEEGNELMRALRNMGWEGQGKGAYEALTDLGGITAGRLHSLLISRGRYTQQTAEEIKKSLFSPVTDDASALRAILAHKYVIEINRLVNNKAIQQSQITPTLIDRIAKTVTDVTKQAKTMKGLLPKPPTALELIRGVNLAVPGEVNKESKKLDKFR